MGRGIGIVLAMMVGAILGFVGTWNLALVTGTAFISSDAGKLMGWAMIVALPIAGAWLAGYRAERVAIARGDVSGGGESVMVPPHWGFWVALACGVGVPSAVIGALAYGISHGAPM